MSETLPIAQHARLLKRATIAAVAAARIHLRIVFHPHVVKIETRSIFLSSKNGTELEWEQVGDQLTQATSGRMTKMGEMG